MDNSNTFSDLSAPQKAVAVAQFAFLTLVAYEVTTSALATARSFYRAKKARKDDEFYSVPEFINN